MQLVCRSWEQRTEAYAAFLALITLRTIHCTTAAEKATDAMRYLQASRDIHSGMQKLMCANVVKQEISACM